MEIYTRYWVNVRHLISIYFLFLAMLLASCKKPYTPPAIKAANAYLVVEGVINSGGDSTIIKLNRTVPVESASTVSPVLQATVTVESDQNTVYLLTDAGSGKYVAASLNLDKTHQYRLHIKTADNREYASDFVPVLNTPPIDSVGFYLTVQGLQIYANTHDPTNQVKYYRWDYDEEWEFHSKVYSKYIVNTRIVNGNEVSTFQDVAKRDGTNSIYFCYTGDVSSDITIASAAKLQQDVVYQAPIITIPSTSEKVELEYSILVKQYALSADAYNFYTALKKSTEQLGSIFDALSTQLNGNIHCISNPAEPLIGYLSINNIQKKRIFIQSGQLPSTWIADYPYDCTQPFVVGDMKAQQFYLIDNPHVFLIADTSAKGYLGTTYLCADCTIRGKVNPPAYWK